MDNTFTNKYFEYFASGNIVYDVADQFSQFCIFQSSIETSQPIKITIPRLLKILPTAILSRYFSISLGNSSFWEGCRQAIPSFLQQVE